MIPRSIHALIDYVFAIILIGTPYALGFSNFGYEHLVFWAVGFSIIIYSLLTNYRLGLVKVIPFRMHLLLDVAGGMVLLISPWLFGFSDRAWVAPFIFGLLELGVVSMTSRSDDRLPQALQH
ncbi:SPW repeat domain-containing protein [Roseomonas marmotae]|uniref:SPW repeat-containing integral membrane domain-containing protein n=1 Tax=Roseomonas marmotae TaxID=2768161 RepID=A0ABS3K766_9PROT|nr:hypothetical protein [Roseomonas marmotae]MBO1073309.1 hypothetical protein [Roseomonas marmotae]QTI79074.1 hypothetical protein IAI58_15795 [Roseomonas marmotae]